MTEVCPCGCGKTLDQVAWQSWNVNEDGDPVTGHYYLADDYTQTATQRTVISGHKVMLDLRGHKLTTEKGRLFLIYGYAAVIDTVGGGRLCAASTGTANGGAVMIAWDAVAMNDALDATFEMYNCTATMEKDKS